MADDELLARLDRHIAETTRHIAETRDFVAEMRELNEGIRIDMRQREERWMRVYRDTTAETQARYAEIAAELRDLREESVAGRRALLAMLDRLPPPEQAA